MLVLSAAFNSAYMRTIVPEDRFKQLLERTIRFLRRLAPISPTCAADCGILEKFNMTLFGVAKEHKDIYHNQGVVEAAGLQNSFGSDSYDMHS